MKNLDGYHYFETNAGPFRNLSSLSSREAEAISQQIRQKGRVFAVSVHPTT